jgi:hypothetical protein
MAAVLERIGPGVAEHERHQIRHADESIVFVDSGCDLRVALCQQVSRRAVMASKCLPPGFPGGP